MSLTLVIARWTAVAVLALGCGGASGGSEPASADRESIGCEEPRPEICAQNYDPVCAQRDTGVRCVITPCESTEAREYPNACGACRDPKVHSYSAGPC